MEETRVCKLSEVTTYEVEVDDEIYRVILTKDYDSDCDGEITVLNYDGVEVNDEEKEELIKIIKEYSD